MSARVRSKELTAWTLLLGTSILLPMLILLGSALSDNARQFAAAEGERQGLASIDTLEHTFEHASGYAGGSCAGTSSVTPATISADVSAMNGVEAAHPLGGDDWKTAASAWSAAPSPAAASDFVDALAVLFPLVSDRSRLTYDPDVAGIDLADSLTYRLPIAIQQLQLAQRLLCSPSSLAERIALSQSVGHAEGYLGDGLSETLEAIHLNPEFADALTADQARAQNSTTRALAALAAFEADPVAARRVAATGANRSAIDGLYALVHTTRPAIVRLIDERIESLSFRRFETIVLAVIVLLAATLIVVFGARNALHRAELRRVRRTSEELRYHATHDMLTDLPNRTALVAAVDEHLERINVSGGSVAVIFIDLDNFKLVNDSLGHEAGDSVLVSIADRLAAIGSGANGALVARFGGDEFAMMLSDTVTQRMQPRVEALVADLTAALGEPVTLRAPFDQQVVITASVGIAFRDDASAQTRVTADLLREADAAMYEAKAGGRSRAEMFGPAMRERATRKLMLMSDLRGATERGEFALEFQPCVRLADGKPVGSEALMRWMHPKLGLLMPGAFLPIAEESGSLVSLGRWAIEEALRRYASGEAPQGSIHVNLSVRELLDGSLDVTIGDLLARFGVPPGALAIEVIEGSLIRSGDRAERMLRRLRGMGTKIWIDDFGVEYSSLRYLHKLPIDGVKIDRTFVGGNDGALAAPSIVKLIVELARSLDLGVVAEGVETDRQRAALIDLGCIHGQGYFFPANAPAQPNARISRIA